MQLKNHNVEFDEENHIYTVDGKKAVSVTQLLSALHPGKYADVPEAVLKEASRKGTELHNAIECYEEYGIERPDLIEFRNYQFLKSRFKWECIANEKMVLIEYKDLFVCGTTDMVYKQNGKLGLADFKRTSAVDKEMVAEQLNLYRIGYMQTYGESIEQLQCIHLREDARKVYSMPINEDYVYELIDAYIEAKEQAENGK